MSTVRRKKYRLTGGRFGRYFKELTLAFLAIFYFVIATNTQTGWLFVLSAFLLGLLATSWYRSRGRAELLVLRQEWLSEPQRGQKFRLRLRLQNSGERLLREIRLECPTPSWAADTPPFAWTVPLLAPNQTAECEAVWTPLKRGEHQLPPCRLQVGAPFGLFVSEKEVQCRRTFLVYPELRRLPASQARSLANASLGERETSRGLGETRNIRSIRDYAPGDDLRDVHWKATAKRGPSALLQVREHHAPAPLRTVVVLDTSRTQPDDELFEGAVTHTASLLWSAHKQGLSALLILREQDGEWRPLQHWSEQYAALARVRRGDDLSYPQWMKESEQALQRLRLRRTTPPVLVKACETNFADWPGWTRRAFLVVRQQQASPSWPEGVPVSQVVP